MALLNCPKEGYRRGHFCTSFVRWRGLVRVLYIVHAWRNPPENNALSSLHSVLPPPPPQPRQCIVFQIHPWCAVKILLLDCCAHRGNKYHSHTVTLWDNRPTSYPPPHPPASISWNTNGPINWTSSCLAVYLPQEGAFFLASSCQLILWDGSFKFMWFGSSIKLANVLWRNW